MGRGTGDHAVGVGETVRSSLIKEAFHPSARLFCLTADQKLYPNPWAFEDVGAPSRLQVPQTRVRLLMHAGRSRWRDRGSGARGAAQKTPRPSTRFWAGSSASFGWRASLWSCRWRAFF